MSSPRRLIFSSILLMLIGIGLLFAVVAGLAGGGVWVALAGFVATLAGLVVGIGGLVRLLRPRAGK